MKLVELPALQNWEYRDVYKGVLVWAKSHILVILVLAAFINGLLYLTTVPPWQHYDEPGHFEYAWLVANRPTWPVYGDYDQSMRRELAASMVEHGFFKNLNITPNLISQSEPIWIGISQVGDPPVYYFLASLPLRILKYTDITLQLYAARWVSLALFCLTIVCVWGATREVVPVGNVLEWMIPAGVLLLPGFVDLMTAINDDVAAVAFFTLLLWGCLQTIRKGITPLRLLWVVGSAALCWYTKNTVYIAVLIAAVALLFGVFRGRWQAIAWAGILAAVVIGGMVFIQWGSSPAFFYLDGTQPIAVRSTVSEGVPQKNKIQLTANPNGMAITLRQIVPIEYVKKLDDQSYTLGAWMWADHPVRTMLPQVAVVDQVVPSSDPWVTISDRPQFFALTGRFPASDHKTIVTIQPQMEAGASPATVYYTGLILTDGERTLDKVPVCDNPGCTTGVWGGEKFTNYIRNADASLSWPSFQPRLAAFINSHFPIRAENLWFFLDYPATRGYFRTAGYVLYHTFWAKFGWAHVSLVWPWVYPILLGITLLGVIGFVAACFVKRRKINAGQAFLLGIALLGVWGMALLRGGDTIFGKEFYSAARYAFPAIFPTMLIIVGGWFGLFSMIRRYLHIPGWVYSALFIVFFVGLDVLSLYTLAVYYQGY